MSKRIIIYLLIFHSFLFLSASDKVFRYTYNADFPSYGIAGTETIDGNYLTVGNAELYIRTDSIVLDCEDCTIPYDTLTFDVITSDILLLKLNTSGDTIWTKKIGEQGNERVLSFCETKDRNIMICTTDSFDNGVVMKLDNNGKQIWNNIYPDHLPKALFEVDNIFYVAGTTSYLVNGNSDIYLQKLDNDGNQFWLKYFGENGNDPELNGTFQDVFQSGCIGVDNNIFLAGENQGKISWYYIDKITGNLLESGKYGNEGKVNVRKVIFNGNTYSVLYNALTMPVTTTQPHLIEINAADYSVHEIDLSQIDGYTGTSLTLSKNNNYVISAVKNNNIREYNTSYFILANNAGIKSFIKGYTYESTDFIYPVNINTTSDNELIVSGVNGQNKLTFQKELINDTLSSDVKNSQTDKLKIFPNPANDFISVLIPEHSESKINITDLSGKLIYSTTSYEPSLIINLTRIKSGVYILNVNTNNTVYYDKLIINN